MTVDLLYVIQRFLQQQNLSKPLLLALSGGPDSLCLFHCLLQCQERLPFQFHVAHIDHGWRSESQEEAKALEALTNQYQIPFHKKVLNPQLLKGNLEEASRQARYAFFEELYRTHGFQAVLLGHQAEDQAETVLKRLLEGSHWAKLGSLQPIFEWNGMPVWRPFLSISKRDILEWLQQRNMVPFEDATNQDQRFLRARMRQTIFPFLNQEFGKEVQQPLRALAEEIQEIKIYFDHKLNPIMENENRGPLGVYLDFTDLQLTSLEIKYLIRKMSEKEGIILSRPLADLATQLIQEGAANRQLEIGHRTFWIDRYKLFILSKDLPEWPEDLSLLPGYVKIGNWNLDVHLTNDPDSISATSWQDGWRGEFRIALPLQDGYRLGSSKSNAYYRSHRYKISKWWNNHKVPAFLCHWMPVVWKGEAIYYEFLTGCSPAEKKGYENWVAIKLQYSL